MRLRFAIILFLCFPELGLAQIPESVATYRWETIANDINPDTVISLDLSKLKLDSVPEALGKFKNLRYLDLGKNKLTDLPAFFSDFQQLEVLILEKNRIEIFPLVICQLKALKHLNFNRNLIARVPECIEYASALEYIDFYDTPIRELPESFARLSNLKKVDFSGIRFSPSFQQKWKTALPNVELIFEEACDCME